jgi:hypothetical protein
MFKSFVSHSNTIRCRCQRNPMEWAAYEAEAQARPLGPHPSFRTASVPPIPHYGALWCITPVARPLEKGRFRADLKSA